MNSRFLSAVAVLALVLGGAHRVRAQSIDYGSLEQLFDEPVTTSATGTPQRVTEVPADMTIITADDIRRSGATDLPTLLSRVPGVDVLNWSAGDSDVSVRGYDQLYSPRLLVLIDGREVYLDDYGRTSWSTLPVTLGEIRQIEVARGPNSALFGFNAVGGVINIITYNPKYDSANGLEVHGGTQADAGASGMATAHLGDRLSARVSAGAERQNQWKNDAGLPSAWNAHAMADVSLQLASRTELRMQGSWARSGTADMVPSDTYNQADYTTRSLMATLASDTSYGQLQARAYVNTLDFKDVAPGYGLVDDKNQVEVVNLQDLFKIGARNTIRLALEYRNNQNNTTPIDTGHLGYRVLSPSAMWTLAATPRLSLTAALQYDDLDLERVGSAPPDFVYSRASLWDRGIDAFSANLGAVYRLTDLDTLRATYAQGAQIPSLVEYGGLQLVIAPPPFPVTLGGNPYLRPAMISNYQLSYDREIPPLDAKASAKVFLQQSDDIKGEWDGTHPLLAPAPQVGGEAVFVNASRSTLAGFELSASGKAAGGFHWNADVTYTRVADKAIGDADLISRQVAFAETTPAFRGNVAGGWSNARWAVDAYLHYVTAYDAYNALGALEQTPAYVTLAGRIGYRLAPGLTLAVSGQNLGAERQVQGLASGLQAERRVLVGLSKTW